MKEQHSNSSYRIRNWPDYNTALVNRGDLTVWVDKRTRQRHGNT
jgi:hypothetical protein